MTIEHVGGGFAAAVTGVLAIGFAFVALSRCRLRLRGVHTTGELVGFRTAVTEDGDLLYRPVVAFTLPDGVKIEAEGESMSHAPHACRKVTARRSSMTQRHPASSPCPPFCRAGSGDRRSSRGAPRRSLWAS
ncbi:hypothetical protein ACWDQ0_34120 [Streptomyces sp. NPDC003642]